MTMSFKADRILIIGAGQGGASLAATLRQRGFAGGITLCGDEAVPPYQRPPLSKAYLKGSISADSMMIRPRSFYRERGIDFRENARARSLDLSGRKVAFEDGTVEPFDFLVLATGSRPRRLDIAGARLPGVHVLRSLSDANGLRDAIGHRSRVVLVGGGYIGLEVAAAVSSMGGQAVVVEREDRLLARVASAELSAFFLDYHGRQNVEIITGAEVEAIREGPGESVSAVTLRDGRAIPCDVVLVCAGGEPNDELARDAGLDCDRGITVDIDGRTSDPRVFAIGDVSRRPLPLYGDRMHRIESVQNAVEQARQVSAAILGLPRPEPEVPWFWSDQFDVKLKIAGLSLDPDEIIVRGSPSSGAFSLLHLRQGALLCVETVNMAADFMASKTLIARGNKLPAAALLDTQIPLKALAA